MLPFYMIGYLVGRKLQMLEALLNTNIIRTNCCFWPFLITVVAYGDIKVVSYSTAGCSFDYMQSMIMFTRSSITESKDCYILRIHVFMYFYITIFFDVIQLTFSKFYYMAWLW